MRLFLTALVACGLATPVLLGQTVTFEDLSLPGANRFENGRNLNPPGGFTSGGATFNNRYNPTFDSWSGWSYSNVTDLTTPGFTNQYAAYSVPLGGTGAGGSANYAVASNFSPGSATIALPPGSFPVSARITNTTYAALSMQTGDQFAKRFGGATGNDPDFFLLTITGRNASGGTTGTVEFYLADFRFDDNSQDYIVSDWTTVDFSPLGAETTVLSFALTSSDVGTFGMNTPAYFALDNLVFAPVPEPATVGLVAAAGLAIALRVRRGSASPA